MGYFSKTNTYFLPWTSLCVLHIEEYLALTVNSFTILIGEATQLHVATNKGAPTGYEDTQKQN